MTTLLHANPQLRSLRPETPVIAAVDTALHAAGPPTLTPQQLRHEQDRSLETPRRRNLLLLPFFASIDVLYGRRLSIEKFLVLEHLAQVPYRSWERVAQRRISRSGGRSVLARRIQHRVAEARAQHDNEQWHMLVMEHLVVRNGRRLTWWRHRRLPRMLALPWQLSTWLIHLVRPGWSYQLNAAFEAHAERSYMDFVATHPETEQDTFDGVLAARWTTAVTVADVLRQIGHDERMHKLDSERRAAQGQRPEAAERRDTDVIRRAA
jgi:ubiquinol oxidase